MKINQIEKTIVENIDDEKYLNFKNQKIREDDLADMIIEKIEISENIFVKKLIKISDYEFVIYLENSKRYFIEYNSNSITINLISKNKSYKLI
jgi:hypothetical protein